MKNQENSKQQYCYTIIYKSDYNYTSQALIFKNSTCKISIDKGKSLELISNRVIEMNESSSQVKH
jgi:hypothetical protein